MDQHNELHQRVIYSENWDLEKDDEFLSLSVHTQAHLLSQRMDYWDMFKGEKLRPGDNVVFIREFQHSIVNSGHVTTAYLNVEKGTPGKIAGIGSKGPLGTFWKIQININNFLSFDLCNVSESMFKKKI